MRAGETARRALVDAPAPAKKRPVCIGSHLKEAILSEKPRFASACKRSRSYPTALPGLLIQCGEEPRLLTDQTAFKEPTANANRPFFDKRRAFSRKPMQTGRFLAERPVRDKGRCEARTLGQNEKSPRSFCPGATKPASTSIDPLTGRLRLGRTAAYPSTQAA